MARSILLLLVMLACGSADGQQPLSLISLPTLDSTYFWHFLERSAGGYVINTQQPDEGVPGSTIITTDSLGTPLSALRINDPMYRMIRCSDGGYLMMGTALVKTDAAFNVLWARKLVNPLPTQSAIKEIAENNGNAYVVFNVKIADIDPSLSFYNTSAAVIFRFNSAGDLMAQRVLADTVFSSGRKNLYLSRPIAGDDGSLYLSMGTLAYFASGTCNRVPTVIKLDSMLNVDWSYQYPMSSFNGVGGLTELGNGDLALFGTYGNNYPYCTYFKNYLERIDTAGNIVFARGYQHTFPAEHSTGAPLERSDGTFVVPRVFMDTVLGHNVPYLDRLDADGDVLASQGFDMPWANSINGILQLARTAGGAIAACRLNKRDSILFAMIDTTLITSCYSVPNATIDTSVMVSRTAFVPGYRSYPFAFSDTTYAPFQSVPVSTITGCDFPTSVDRRIDEHQVTIFPNPSHGEVHITASRPITDLIITDALGRIVHRSAPYRGGVSVDMPTAGMYFIHLSDGERECVRMVVVEDR